MDIQKLVNTEKYNVGVTTLKLGCQSHDVKGDVKSYLYYKREKLVVLKSITKRKYSKSISIFIRNFPAFLSKKLDSVNFNYFILPLRAFCLLALKT